MKKFLALLIAVISIFSLLTFSSCDKTNDKVIAVSIVPYQTFVKEIVIDKFTVEVAVPIGQSPETYEPKPKEVVNLNLSKIYFSVGIPNEEITIIPSLNTSVKVIKIAPLLVNSGLPDRHFDNGARDPHIWLSIKRAIKTVEIMLNEIIKIDSENAEFYTENANNYINKLNSLYNELTAKFSSVSDSKRKMIVYHPSFGYFANEFNITMYAIENEGHEVTAKDILNAINYANANGLKTIFYQAETDSANAVAFANEIGGEAIMLNPLSGDYINNLRGMANAILS